MYVERHNMLDLFSDLLCKTCNARSENPRKFMIDLISSSLEDRSSKESTTTFSEMSSSFDDSYQPQEEAIAEDEEVAQCGEITPDDEVFDQKISEDEKIDQGEQGKCFEKMEVDLAEGSQSSSYAWSTDDDRAN